MTREIGCAGCGRKLSVAEECAETAILCPDCERQSTPAEESSAPLHSPPERAEGNPQHESWYLLTPEGPVYGPIFWADVEQWAAEGRIDAACQLGNSTAGPWRAAGELVPALRVHPPPGPAAAASPLAGSSQNALDAPAAEARNSTFAPPAPAAWIAPHRGTIIFILGLLGLVVGCPVFSFAAWAMATRDLAEMRGGRMDQSGEGLTLGGFILGLIASLMWCVCLLGVLLVLLVYAASRL